MPEEPQAAAPADGEDTAAVLAQASGEKTYLKDPEDTPEPEVKAEDSGDDAPAEIDEPPAEKPKAKKSVQDRIDELTREKHELARDRDFYREQALRGQPPAAPAPEAQDVPQDDGRPDPNDYASHDDYLEDLTDWKAERAATRIVSQRDQRDQVNTVLGIYKARTKELYPEGKPEGLKAFEELATIPQSVNEIVAASEIGPRIAEHLGANPAELARLERLSPILQARELTLLETRLAIPAKPTPKTATDAPEPPPQARGTGGQFKVAADTDDFAAFERQHVIGR